MSRDDGPSAHEVEQALRARVDDLVPELLTGAMRDGAFWCAGSVRGEAGQSLKVNRNGPRRGLWTDFSAAEGTDEYSGDMLQLIAVVKFGGWSKGKDAQRDAIRWAKDRLGWEKLGGDKLREVRRDSAARDAAAEEAARIEAEGKRKSAIAMWNGAVPIERTAAEAYLRSREIDFDRMGRIPGSLRYLPDCWCSIRRSKHPALVACIYLGAAFRGVHRTYLDVSQGKGSPVGVVKTVRDPLSKKFRLATAADREAGLKLKSYKLTLGDYSGGCITLWKGGRRGALWSMAAGTSVYVSEGIEDGLSVAVADPSLTVVAGVALANMGALELPEQAGPIVFIGQNDPIYVERPRAVEAFERVIGRQQLAAREARRPPPQIIWPKPQFKDFNDQLMGKVMA
jgi:hypothetical protein